MGHETKLIDIRYVREFKYILDGVKSRAPESGEEDYIDKEGRQHIFIEDVCEYIEERHPVGCVALVEVDGEPVLGWSLCAKEDKFSYKMARELAKTRAESRFEDPEKDNLRLEKEEFWHFRDRCLCGELFDALESLLEG